jgi:hypothetical protein
MVAVVLAAVAAAVTAVTYNPRGYLDVMKERSAAPA